MASPQVSAFACRCPGQLRVLWAGRVAKLLVRMLVQIHGQQQGYVV